MDELTLAQESFCRFYTQNSELFGNATLAYAEAYDYKLEDLSKDRPLQDTETGKLPKYGDSEYDRAYMTCAVNGSRMLKLAKIQNRVIVLLNEHMKNEVIDAELMKIIMTGEDKDRVAAIKEYNKLRQRIIEKTDITSGGKPIIQLATEVAEKHVLNTSPSTDSEGQPQI